MIMIFSLFASCASTRPRMAHRIWGCALLLTLSLGAGPLKSRTAQAEPLEPQVARLPLDAPMAGPIPAMITRVIDGDTVVVEVQTWLNQSLATSVRIEGIDTPEIRGKCDDEKALAQQAKALVESLTPVGSLVTLHNVTQGKYAGRVVADIRDLQGRSVAEALLTSRLAHPYDGRSKRQPWCP